MCVVLGYGPPGTGKTMLAKAVANHTTAAFIRVIGSEFVQKYLGEVYMEPAARWILLTNKKIQLIQMVYMEPAARWILLSNKKIKFIQSNMNFEMNLNNAIERFNAAAILEDTLEDTAPMVEDTALMVEDIAHMVEDTAMIEETAPASLQTNNVVQWTDPYSYEVFTEFQPRHGWFKIKPVRVQYVYKDVQRNQLYLFLLDKNRDRILAVVTSDLMRTFEPMILEGGIFSIESFQFGFIGCDDFPRYGTYPLHRDDYELRFYKKTKLIPLESTSVGFELPFYPKLYPLNYLASVTKKMLIDVLGKPVRGELKSFRDPWNFHRPRYLELILKDLSGQELKMKLYDPWSSHFPVPLARAIRDKCVIFITRVKVDPTREKNVLICSSLSAIDYAPRMPEAETMRQLMI